MFDILQLIIFSPSKASKLYNLQTCLRSLMNNNSACFSKFKFYRCFLKQQQPNSWRQHAICDNYVHLSKLAQTKKGEKKCK